MKSCVMAPHDCTAMSRLVALLKEARASQGVQKGLYGPFPVHIAESCGPPEISEIIDRLDTLSAEFHAIEEWDGETRDDIWRAQKGFSELLEQLTAHYPTEIAHGLKSNSATTRFWVAHAFSRAPTSNARPELEQALRTEDSELTRSVLISAIASSMKMGGHIGRTPGVRQK